jgi:hypothetical protein
LPLYLLPSGSQPIEAKKEGIAGNSGKLSFTMYSGEFVSGQRIAVDGRSTMTKGAATAHGNKGSVFDVEFECDGSARGIGNATDNHGRASERRASLHHRQCSESVEECLRALGAARAYAAKAALNLFNSSCDNYAHAAKTFAEAASESF